MDVEKFCMHSQESHILGLAQWQRPMTLGLGLPNRIVTTRLQRPIVYQYITTYLPNSLSLKSFENAGTELEASDAHSSFAISRTTQGRSIPSHLQGPHRENPRSSFYAIPIFIFSFFRFSVCR